jgi:hypothetical protein
VKYAKYAVYMERRNVNKILGLTLYEGRVRRSGLGYFPVTDDCEHFMRKA